jgi:hypothetical protein
MTFWFNKITLGNAISAIALLYKYLGFGKYERKANERNYAVVIHHNLGKSDLYSRYLTLQGRNSTLRMCLNFR